MDAILLSQASGLEKLFWFCALVGGAIFLVRLVLQFIGGDVGDLEGAEGLDGLDGMDGLDGLQTVEVDISDTDLSVDSVDSYLSFKLLSFQGLTAFFMMFGLVGLAMIKQNPASPAYALGGGVVGGLITVWILKKFFEYASRLQSSGNVGIAQAVGREGTVYVTLPAQGAGQVQVNISNRLRIYDACTADGSTIPTGKRIRVVRISDNVLVVELAAGSPETMTEN